MENREILNWVDPDIVAFSSDNADFDLDLEKGFKEFFISGWNDPIFEKFHERWSAHLSDESPHARVLAKTSIWSIAQHREPDFMKKFIR